MLDGIVKVSCSFGHSILTVRLQHREIEIQAGRDQDSNLDRIQDTTDLLHWRDLIV